MILYLPVPRPPLNHPTNLPIPLSPFRPLRTRVNKSRSEPVRSFQGLGHSMSTLSPDGMKGCTVRRLRIRSPAFAKNWPRGLKALKITYVRQTRVTDRTHQDAGMDPLAPGYPREENRSSLRLPDLQLGPSSSRTPGARCLAAVISLARQFLFFPCRRNHCGWAAMFIYTSHSPIAVDCEVTLC